MSISPLAVSPLAVALASITLSALAQFALKMGATRAMGAAREPQAAVGPLQLVLASLSQPWVLVGFALYGVGALLWLYVLARWDVSKAYPMVSLGFILTLLIGALAFGEQVGWQRAAGVTLICAGLVVLVRT